MSIIRQDAWSSDEDLTLAKTVLSHIREGSTQLAAFEEVGKSLSRTPAACGFRWNSLVRKKYENEIAQAKAKRKELKRESKISQDDDLDEALHSPSEEIVNELEFTEINLEKVIHFLIELKSELPELMSKNELVLLKNELERLSQKKETLENSYRKLETEYKTIKRNYEIFIQLVDRAKENIQFDKIQDDALRYSLHLDSQKVKK
ncbi:RsfA family transcriptional regulator [Terrilactibacillus sp. BCM23-1]|uniref:RsfA family transcriptional regulator n=1 Tax=Terrilactibacillus tamarindi TaxID=2599694 RepID=A0A6N8CUY5_9BACI|nr:RsfA family transcriptional regulator [Terrilactibacillus tamarindi]MTT32006.1 RsfA family transcriptional regulator [Terrilactibacillus tamarindi]